MSKKQKGDSKPPAETEPDEEPKPAARDDELPAIDESTVFSGELLRRFREGKGITLKEISKITRIGVPSLRAVEDERYDDLPNARIYVRGFVRSYALEVGLDPDRVAKSYLPRWERWFDNQKGKGKGYFRSTS